MHLLYMRPTCPYCHRVLDYAKEHNIPFTLKDIGTDDAARRELIQRGGKQQVPYFVSSEGGIEMYESEDIVEYLSKIKS